MHKTSLDLNLKEITKTEGSAGLEVKVINGKVKYIKFKIQDYKRFYTQAIRGKPAIAAPQILARICGTCSNAHLMCSIEAIEKAFNVEVSEQTLILKKLTYNGLIIRDHAMHLYIFVLPDLYKKDSLLEFSEKNKEQHQLLHNAFEVKGAGNHLSIAIAGRSVHAPHPIVGGFLKMPEKNQIHKILNELKSARPAVLHLIKIFKDCQFSLKRKTNYIALKAEPFSFLKGKLYDQNGLLAEEKNFRKHLEHVVIPYSQASAYKFRGEPYRVGALARLNINKNALYSRTKKHTKQALALFPSNNIFYNNLAQAIEILHCIDESIELLSKYRFKLEKPIVPKVKKSIGIGVIEAPRGTLYHKLEINKNGTIEKGEVIVPTGQNQLSIELDIAEFIQNNLDMSKKRLAYECEKIIRAYDPCMSCASHFLKLKWI